MRGYIVYVCPLGGGWWGDDGVKVTVCQQDKKLGDLVTYRLPPFPFHTLQEPQNLIYEPVFMNPGSNLSSLRVRGCWGASMQLGHLFFISLLPDGAIQLYFHTHRIFHQKLCPFHKYRDTCKSSISLFFFSSSSR